MEIRNRHCGATLDGMNLDYDVLLVLYCGINPVLILEALAVGKATNATNITRHMADQEFYQQLLNGSSRMCPSSLFVRQKGRSEKLSQLQLSIMIRLLEGHQRQ